MKKILTLAVALIATIGSVFAASLTYNVTVPAGTNECYIAGAFNSWSFAKMTKVDDTHYTISIEGATAAQGYKYSSGPDWAYVEKTSTGGEMKDRTYSASDVVAKWANVYEPSVVVTYSTFRVCIQYDSAPTIWWWGAGSKCANATDTVDPEDPDGKNYAWPGPKMKPLPGADGWYYWEFVDVDNSLGVTFKIDENNIGEKNAKEQTAYTKMGAVTTWPATSDPTIVRTVYCDNNKPKKVVENGQIIIIVDGEKYDLSGRKIE